MCLGGLSTYCGGDILWVRERREKRKEKRKEKREERRERDSQYNWFQHN